MKPQAPTKITVQAGEDRIVRLQDRRLLKPGMPAVRLPWSLYLQRRLDCGDLVAVADQTEKGPSPVALPPKPASLPPAASAPEPTKGAAS